MRSPKSRKKLIDWRSSMVMARKENEEVEYVS
jgi:hypothetical protein